MKTEHYYLLSIVIALTGLMAFGIYLYRSYLSLNDLLVPVHSPGKTVINADRGDMYEVYYEGSPPGSGSNHAALPFTLTVRDYKGVFMPVQRVKEPKKYSYRGRTGRAVYQVNLPGASSYEFLSSVNNEIFNKGPALFFDRGFSEKRAKIILTAQGILLFPVLTSLVLFLYAYSKK